VLEPAVYITPVTIDQPLERVHVSLVS
jgi:hypothetical protein